MAIKPICRLGNPVLRQIAQKLSKEEILSPNFNELIQDMKDTMDHLGGIGIAAPQIGVSKAVTIIQLEDDNPRYPDNDTSQGLTIIVNPEIKIIDKNKQGFWEGCLSVPGLRGFVERPQQIQVEYLNEKAEKVVVEAQGFLATVFQHEIDHLFGQLYTDKISDPSKFSFEEEFEQFHHEE